MTVANQWSGDQELDTFVLKVGDRNPVLGLFLKYYDGTARDLTNCTVKLVVATAVGGRRLIDEVSMTVVTAATGEISYTWAANQLVEGEYLMEILVFNASNHRESFPRGGYYKLVIVPHL